MDSDDFSEDQNRKRGAENYEIFQNSKRKHRSPTKTNDEKFEKILKLMQEMKTEIKDEMKQIREDQKSYAMEMKKLKEENEDLRKENESIKAELTEIKQNMESIDKEKRKNNIVLSGLKMDTNNQADLKKDMENFFQTNLQLGINVRNAIKIGENRCLIQLNNGDDKQAVMNNKYKLKYKRNEKIFLNNDMTKQERIVQRQIRKLAKDEKEKGKEVKIGYNKVTINGEVWRWNRVNEKIVKSITKN